MSRHFKIIFLICLLIYLPSKPVIAKSKCDPSSWKLSIVNIGLEDKAYIKMVMGFSYGAEVAEYIPKLEVARSNIYYKESKAKPLLTFFHSEYEDDRTATRAFNHLQLKWKGNKKNQYDIHKAGRKVIWFGNIRLEAECFNKIVAQEKRKIIK